jgi:uncharacterized coiled-coil protein SlyX
MSKTLMEKLNTLAAKAGFKFESKDGKVELSKVAEVKLMDAKLADGSTISTSSEEWAAGVDVVIVDADGNSSPAADGEYILESGESIVVAGGLVAEIKPKEEMKQEEVEMEAEITAKVDALISRVAELETANAAQATELASVQSKLSETETKLSAANAEVTKLSKKAAVASVKEVKVDLKKEDELTPAQRFLKERKDVRAIIDNVKSN